MLFRRTTTMGLSIALLLVAGAAFAAKVGDAAPKWSNLPGVDDKKHSLDDYQDAKALVVVFTCNQCPVAKAYEDRLIELAKDYKDKSVQVVAINVNDAPQDSFEKMKERAQEKGFNFPYLYDESQKSAQDYEAKVTPHLYILDKDRKVAYIGALDDNNSAKQVKDKYARDALDAVLAAKEPPKAETTARGCTIKWKK